MPQVVPMMPPTKTNNSRIADRTGPRFLWISFRSRYALDGGRAMTGSLFRCRLRSIARPLAVSYRRVRSFSRHFITIQSRSRSIAECGTVRPCGSADSLESLLFADCEFMRQPGTGP